MGITSDEDLDVYNKSFDLVLAIYDWARTFPVEERFALVVQMHRAAASIPANIAEGSAEELCVFIRLATKLGYPNRPPDPLRAAKDVAKMLHRLGEVTLTRA
jgi:23S rRNA-intervening sequence protein